MTAGALETGGAARWVLAARPKTLTAAVVPVLVGTALALRDGAAHLGAAAAALAGALCIQVGTNLVNDAYDFRRGADGADRLGPVRATQAGLISPGTVLAGAGVAFALATACGLYLAGRGGWPIVAVGLASLLCGWAYTGGPWPLAYLGLGDVFVFVFFGPVAVLGTEWVQAREVSTVSLLASVPVGLLAAALLVVNNLRDIPTDARVGKRTLAVRLGARAARLQYAGLLLCAAAGVAATAVAARTAWALLPLVVAPLAWTVARRVWRSSGRELNAALGQTARLHAAAGALLALGLALGAAW